MSVGVSVTGRDGAGGTALRLNLVCNSSTGPTKAGQLPSVHCAVCSPPLALSTLSSTPRLFNTQLTVA